MRILLVDGFVLFRQGLMKMLDGHPDFCVVGEAASAEGALGKVFQLKPDVILMDINLPDQHGLEIIPAILNRLPETKIVILTTYETDDLLVSAIRSGAKGYLLKDIHINKLMNALRALDRGEVAFSRAMTARIVEEFRRMGVVHNLGQEVMKALTSRECEILCQLGTGASNREIAERLFIAENTVKNHISKVLHKLKMRNRSEARVFARRMGL